MRDGRRPGRGWTRKSDDQALPHADEARSAMPVPICLGAVLQEGSRKLLSMCVGVGTMDMR